MRKHPSLTLVLTGFLKLGRTTRRKISVYTSLPVKNVDVYINRYRKSGYLELVNPGGRPAVHRLTDLGRQVQEHGLQQSVKATSCVPVERMSTAHLSNVWFGG